MEKEEAKELIRKYQDGKCTDAEKILVENAFLLYNEQNLDISTEKIEDIGDEIYRRLPRPDKNNGTIKLWSVIATVAAVSLVGISTWWFKKMPESSDKSYQVKDIRPGGSKATLTLANGKIINLSHNKAGIIINDNKISYSDGINIANNSSGLATISTPKGGEYQIVLSDGTKVWLNAASTLQYPAVFRERTARKVKLVSGEAYFEVSKDKKRPFIVTTGNQDVMVLGTHFNINAYTLATGIKTTLLEGSVKVTVQNTNHTIQTKVLDPGEQATCTSDLLTSRKVNLDIETAWKNGKTEFVDADIESIMTMLERWYNIEVIYHGKPTTSLFTGSVSRSKNISEVLELLESTGDVHFKIEGRRVEILEK